MSANEGQRELAPCPKCGGPTERERWTIGPIAEDVVVCTRTDEPVEECPGERRERDRRAPTQEEPNALADLASWNAVTEYARKHGYVLVPAGNVTTSTGTSTQEPVVPDGMVLVSREAHGWAVYDILWRLLEHAAGIDYGNAHQDRAVWAAVDEILGTGGSK